MTAYPVYKLVYELLERGGLTHQQIADEVRRRLPNAKTTAKSVASHAVGWRRSLGRPTGEGARPALPTIRSAPPLAIPALPPSVELLAVGELITQARATACAYYRLTGRPLGITGEVGEYEAARILGLALAPGRTAGFDALDAAGRRLQVKARSFASDANPGQRVGGIKLDHPWDAVLLVLLDPDLMPVEIWEADRPAVEAALLAPGSRARNERGALGVPKFKAIGYRRWRRPIQG